MDLHQYIFDEAAKRDFPAPIEVNEYHEPTSGNDILQVYMRAHTDREHLAVADKFAFEIAVSSDALLNQAKLDIVKREIQDGLDGMYDTWLSHCEGIIYRGAPYAQIIKPDSFGLRCQQCHAVEGRMIEDIDVMSDYWDVLTLFLLKELNCPCQDKWTTPTNGVYESLQVDEGEIIPRLN